MGTYIATAAPLEADLMQRVQARESGAFQELFQRFRHKIYRTALRILKEEESAQDALQETLLKIYRSAHHFRGDSKMGTWINRITVNVCLEMIRRNRKHQQRVGEDVADLAHLLQAAGGDPHRRFCQREVGRKVKRALLNLGPKHRSVVDLHDLQGYTIREIAQILRVAEGTVKSRLFYGREELKRQLQR